jgi:haloalkane dehalogenase
LILANHLVSFQSVRQRFEQVGEHRIGYLEEGEGPTVVLVHGSPVSSRSFRRQIEALSGRFRIIAPDLLGFGETVGPARGASFTEQAEMLRRFIDRVVPGPFSLVVHDWGGPIGVGAAADRFEDIRGLVLMNTTVLEDFKPPLYWKLFVNSPPGKILMTHTNLVSWFLPTMMQAARSADPGDYYRLRLEKADARQAVLALERLTGYRPLMEKVRTNLDRLRAPTLIVWGRPDPYFSSKDLERLTRRFPDAAVKEIPGAGHFPQEDAPEEVTAALEAFLDGL